VDGGRRLSTTTTTAAAALWGGGIIMVSREVLIPTCFSSIPVCEITEALVNRFTACCGLDGVMGRA
jgi:hypothetical protein